MPTPPKQTTPNDAAELFTLCQHVVEAVRDYGEMLFDNRQALTAIEAAKVYEIGEPATEESNASWIPRAGIAAALFRVGFYGRKLLSNAMCRGLAGSEGHKAMSAIIEDACTYGYIWEYPMLLSIAEDDEARQRVIGEANGLIEPAIEALEDVMVMLCNGAGAGGTAAANSWQQIREDAERVVRAGGGEWPGFSSLAKRLECSIGVLQKAVDKSNYLKARMAEKRAIRPAGRKQPQVNDAMLKAIAAPSNGESADEELNRLIAESNAENQRENPVMRAKLKRK